MPQHIAQPQLSSFRNKVLAAVTTETSPAEIAHTLGCSPERARAAMYALARGGYLIRPCRGLYRPKGAEQQ